VVVDSCFARFKNTMARRMKALGAPSARLAWQVAAWALVAAAVMTEGRIDQVDPILWTRHVKCPTLFIQGALDELVTVNEARQMAEQCTAPHELWVVPGTGHRGAFGAHPAEYNQRVTGWFRQHLS
jgi:pimeloyl-ACP methyl ester carboxylesterase